MSFHPIFDFERWQQKLTPSEVLTNNNRFQAVTSPSHAVYRQIQLDVIEAFFNEEIEFTPIDGFVFGLGEPKEPFLTKVGGLPYRDARKPWPELHGRSLEFLCQICFLDSKDILSVKVPGDTLLCFCELGNLNENLYFEWVDLGIRELESGKSLPPELFGFSVRHGQRWRTVDWSLAQSTDTSLAGHLSQCGRYSGFKIGGKVPFLNSEPNLKNDDCVAMVNYLDPSKNDFPWVNSELKIKVGQGREFTGTHPDPARFLTIDEMSSSQSGWFDLGLLANEPESPSAFLNRLISYIGDKNDGKIKRGHG